jgi:hypothetical protein
VVVHKRPPEISLKGRQSIVSRRRPLSSAGLAVFLAVSGLQESLNPKVQGSIPCASTIL